MKLIAKNRKTVFALAVICTLMMTGCQEGDGDADYGFPYVYIPQATFTGLNNFYPVPGGSGDYSTLTYKVEKQGNTPTTLNVLLGVLRSGKFSDAGGFTVNVDVLSGMTSEMIASGEITDAVALPSSMYTIPNKVSVESGSNNASFYLSVDIGKLMDGTYNGKNLVLAVGISNPEPKNFLLSETNTSVVVIIDVDAMRDALYNN